MAPGYGRLRPVDLPVMPPVSPMLAKLARELPAEGGMLYEPKWDGFRCIVFRDGDEIELGSRNERPLTRYFPELVDPAAGAAAGPLRPRRRDRDRHRRRARLRGAPPADPSRRLPRSSCWPARRRRRSWPSICWPRATTTFDLYLRLSVDDGSRPRWPGPGRRCTSRPARPTGPWPRSGSTPSRAPGSTAWWPSRSTSPTGRASGSCSRSSTSGRPTAWWPASGGTRAAG